LLHWSIGSPFMARRHGHIYIHVPQWHDIFPLGYGDVTPLAPIAARWRGRSGMGFAFLAILISYLPVLYQGVLSARADDLAA